MARMIADASRPRKEVAGRTSCSDLLVGPRPSYRAALVESTSLVATSLWGRGYSMMIRVRTAADFPAPFTVP